MAGSTLFNREEGRQEAVQSPVKALLQDVVWGGCPGTSGGMETAWSKETRSSTAETYKKRSPFTGRRWKPETGCWG